MRRRPVAKQRIAPTAPAVGRPIDECFPGSAVISDDPTVSRAEEERVREGARLGSPDALRLRTMAAAVVRQLAPPEVSAREQGMLVEGGGVPGPARNALRRQCAAELGDRVEIMDRAEFIDMRQDGADAARLGLEALEA